MDLAWIQGAHYFGEGKCRFRLWAPKAQRVELCLLSPRQSTFEMTGQENGYFEVLVHDLFPGQRYLYRLDEKLERPDPASRFQPEGVHGPSEVIDPSFDWTDECWHGVPLPRHVIYELHVGLYTAEGTFDALIRRLDQLRELGVNAVELMPVAQFSGTRNWGYDGVYPFSAQNSYGGPQGLRRLVTAAHEKQMAVLLDVVYNHLGPEGNYLHDFAPYFTRIYQTPWGEAINFDGPESDEVRRYFIANALSWVQDFHIDGLRLDATHAIIDLSADPFLGELVDNVNLAADRLNRHIHLFAESDRNDSHLIRSKDVGGLGMHAQWNDDFHHALFTLLPGADATAYLNDYGQLEQLEKAYEAGYVYTGEYSPYRRRRHGNSSRLIHGKRFVVFSQNHDQVGNRVKGDRLSTMVSFESLKLAAASYLLSPYIPLIFMGEEYGEETPFLYFVSHFDPQLVEAVRKGRAEEFSHYFLSETPPDPQDESTFLSSKLNLEQRHQGKHKVLWELYRKLLALRAKLPVLADLNKEEIKVSSYPKERVIVVRRMIEEQQCVLMLNLGEVEAEQMPMALSPGRWTVLVDTADSRWLGPGSMNPQEVDSQGVALISLRPTSALLLFKEALD